MAFGMLVGQILVVGWNCELFFLLRLFVCGWR